MTYQDFQNMFPNFKGKLILYISGSQGISNNTMIVEYNKDFNDLETLANCFDEFIDNNILENIDNYLDDEEDENEAFSLALVDSGEFLVGTDDNNLTYKYYLGKFERYE